MRRRRRRSPTFGLKRGSPEYHLAQAGRKSLVCLLPALAHGGSVGQSWCWQLAQHRHRLPLPHRQLHRSQRWFPHQSQRPRQQRRRYLYRRLPLLQHRNLQQRRHRLRSQRRPPHRNLQRHLLPAPPRHRAQLPHPQPAAQRIRETVGTARTSAHRLLLSGGSTSTIHTTVTLRVWIETTIVLRVSRCLEHRGPTQRHTGLRGARREQTHTVHLRCHCGRAVHRAVGRGHSDLVDAVGGTVLVASALALFVLPPLLRLRSWADKRHRDEVGFWLWAWGASFVFLTLWVFCL